MSRYLTPTAIGLLVLVHLYSRGAIGWRARRAVLAMLAAHVLPATLSDVSSPHRLLARSIPADGKPGRPSNMVIDPVCLVEALDRLDPRLGSRFVDELWQIRSVDRLHVLVRRLGGALVPAIRKRSLLDEIEGVEDDLDDGGPDSETEEPGPGEQTRFTRTSPLGVFVRRARLEFVRLPFHDVVRLWCAFVAFRTPTEARWRMDRPDAPVVAFDDSFAVFVDQAADEESESGRDIGLLESVVYPAGAEADGVSTHNIERLMELQVEHLQLDGSRLDRPVRDGAARLAAGRAAVPSLSHCVNFLDSQAAGDFASAFDSLHRYFDYAMQSRDRTHYQYALLNLAVLQAGFGGYAEARSTVAETIATARENNDVDCLSSCLALVRELGDETGEDGAAVLRRQAGSAKSTGTLVSALLFDARAGAADAGRAAELVLQASHLALSQRAQLHFGAVWTAQAGLFARLGAWTVADGYLDVLSGTYAGFVRADDRVRARVMRALGLASQGRFADALGALGPDPGADRSLRPHRTAVAGRKLVELRRAVAEVNVAAAEQLISELEAMPVPADLRISVAEARAAMAVRTGDIAAAFDSIAAVDPAGDPDGPARLLVAKADVFVEAGMAERAFSSAVDAAAAAASAGCAAVVWASVAVVAEVLLRACEFGPARRCVEAVAPAAREAGSAARLYEILGDGWVGGIGAGEVEMADGLRRAERAFRVAADEAARAGDVWIGRRVGEKRRLVAEMDVQVYA